MNLRKRTLALLLTLCLLLSVAVPMVSAADLYIKIQMGNNSEKGHDQNWEYIATSEGAVDLDDAAGSYLTMMFKSANSTNGDWIAVRIKDAKGAIAAGSYHLCMNAKKYANNGQSDVYYLPDTNKTGADLQTYIANNMTNDNYLGVFDSTISALQDFGAVDLAGGSFILVFKCSAVQKQEEYRTYLTSVNLVPVQTAGDADSLAAALANIADNAGGRFSTVKLTADFAAGDVSIPKNVTLDLNGHTLTVTSFTNAGKQVGSGSVQEAGQGGSTVTPPAGGESGGTVTPPAGGESGGTVTPPAGGESGGTDTPPQTGDASPVLFAVVALAASLLAMVALIPNKKRA